tara:strand:+ start:357 stop:479 length:123 start_codon:yes stop_codon:yes gene_type:complete
MDQFLRVNPSKATPVNKPHTTGLDIFAIIKHTIDMVAIIQ